MSIENRQDRAKRLFVKQNFAAAFREESENNRVLGYDNSNGYIIRDWQQLVRDAIVTLEYAFDKIHDVF